MKIKGKYLKKLLEYVDCEILLEYGKIQRIKFASRQISNSHIPIDKSKFTLEKLSSEPGMVPVDSNYEIKYINKSNEEKKIYLYLDYFQVWKYKWNTKQYIIQSKELKTDILKYIIGGVLGFLGTIMIQHFTQVDKQIIEKEPTKITNTQQCA